MAGKPLTSPRAPASAIEWTPDLVERVRVMWFDGMSASQCAARIGMGLTRSAITGVVYRHGWRRSGEVMRTTVKIAQTVRMAPARKPPKPLPRPKPALVADTPGIGIMELTLATCRRPVGGSGSETIYCGKPAPEEYGKPYCYACERLCWTGTLEKRSRVRR